MCDLGMFGWLFMRLFYGGFIDYFLYMIRGYYCCYYRCCFFCFLCRLWNFYLLIFYLFVDICCDLLLVLMFVLGEE